MSKLSDLYNSVRTTKELGVGINHEDFERRVTELEDEIWQTRVLPALDEVIRPALDDIRHKLHIVVDYEPGQPLKAYMSRPYTEPEPEPVVEEPSDLAEPLPADDYPQATTTRSSAQRLRVTFADGRVVQETTAAATLAQVVRIIGVDLVAMVVEEKKLRCCRVPILSKEWSPRYRGRQKRVGGGWLLMTHSSTESKIDFLETVSDELGLKLRIEPTTNSE